MKPYKSKSGKKSGVTGFQFGTNFITVKFTDKLYRYTYLSAGKTAVEKMKELALAQEGLSTFIAQNNPGYEK